MRTPLWTVLAALLLSSCGGAPRTLVEPDVRARLMASVSEVDDAARRHDRVASEAALAELTRGIAAAQAEGRLDPAYARSLLAAADRVAEDVATLPMPGPRPPVVVTVPAQPPPGRTITLPGTTVTAPPETALPPGQPKKQAEQSQVPGPVPDSAGSPPANGQNGQSGDNAGNNQSQNGQDSSSGQEKSDGQGSSGEDDQG